MLFFCYLLMMLFRYNIYFNGFIFCEFLNFAIVIVQFVITNQFLSRRFLFYGLEVPLLILNSKYRGKMMDAGLALLPSSLGGAKASFCQEPNVSNVSKDRFVSVLKIVSCKIVPKC